MHPSSTYFLLTLPTHTPLQNGGKEKETKCLFLYVFTSLDSLFRKEGEKTEKKEEKLSSSNSSSYWLASYPFFDYKLTRLWSGFWRDFSTRVALWVVDKAFV